MTRRRQDNAGLAACARLPARRAAPAYADSLGEAVENALLRLSDFRSTLRGVQRSERLSGGYLQFASNGAVGTLVRFDANGGGDSFVTLANLTNALLTPGDTTNYLI